MRDDNKQFNMINNDINCIITLDTDCGDDMKHVHAILTNMCINDKYITLLGTCGRTTYTRIK